MSGTEQEIEYVDNGARCPKCGSDNVSKPRLDMVAAALTILVLNFPIFPFKSKRVLCYDCGHKFRLNK